jgi:hypothetical protein
MNERERSSDEGRNGQAERSRGGMMVKGKEMVEEEHQLMFVIIVGRRDIGKGFVHRTNVTSAADEDIYPTSAILAT